MRGAHSIGAGTHPPMGSTTMSRGRSRFSQMSTVLMLPSVLATSIRSVPGKKQGTKILTLVSAIHPLIFHAQHSARHAVGAQEILCGRCRFSELNFEEEFKEVISCISFQNPFQKGRRGKGKSLQSQTRKGHLETDVRGHCTIKDDYLGVTGSGHSSPGESACLVSTHSFIQQIFTEHFPFWATGTQK